ncbi:MAG: SDR family oxidoreductase [Vicinamibacterales bacterium]|jgi:acetoacetyl-CoA reductase/3-oxoacyl-[acyl-carrier protein] reductase|nr:dehydrogenase [Acidobacteriota bacterium]MDP7294940.1 SDR family oxidoreductase [Vicinamibacterales bacterium]MDP7473016.1 SDR family oxidoreductase [Vicinamibacterales bacterium]MDP7670360.1 SDR family oxidoreductase [Vicinamibacterales bacterium]HJO38017.1 SDR family oxidoreductase [Vicinamibacterales bacterium]|tara:strand:- start:1330 stop:2052 length:723 start_codon:yes stop_codon:yes gene_type:complete
MPTTIDLSDQTAWVTGGASGIGAASGAALGEAGARVVRLDRAFASQADPELEIAVDLRSTAAINTAVARLCSRGLEPDILVNCAGIARDQVSWKMSDDEWADVIDVNLSGVFRMTRACCAVMRPRQRGAIVNIASINGIRGKFGQANYAASKGGVIALTKTLARELARDGIRVNAIAPGLIDTPMTKSLPPDVREQAIAGSLLGRIGRPEDVGAAVLFLASPLAAFITGQVLTVDGGQLV